MISVIDQNIRIGKAAAAPMPAEDIIRMEHCPRCEGRGWFLGNPFATGGTNGCGGISNIRQCLTCLDCNTYYERHGKLPMGYELPQDKPTPSLANAVLSGRLMANVRR